MKKKLPSRVVILALILFFLFVSVLIKFTFFTKCLCSITAREAHCKSDMVIFEGGLMLFFVDLNRLPTEEEGLNALITDLGIENWNGPYITPKAVPDFDKLIIDPWGNKIKYTLQDGKAVLSSAGKDKIEGNENDITLEIVPAFISTGKNP